MTREEIDKIKELKKYSIENVKVYSFSVPSYNCVYLRETEEELDDVESYKELYSVTGKLRKNSEGHPRAHFWLDHMIGDQHVIDVIEEAGVKAYAYVPNYGWRSELAAINYLFSISVNDIPKLQAAWEERFGEGTFSFGEVSVDEMKECVASRKADLAEAVRIYEDSVKATEDLNVELIRKNDKILDALVKKTGRFSQLLGDLRCEPDDTKIAEGNALAVVYDEVVKKIAAIRENHNDILRRTAEKIAIRDVADVTVPDTVEIPLSESEEVIRDLNTKVMNLVALVKAMRKRYAYAEKAYQILKNSFPDARKLVDGE